jgi:hypothetical protein
MIHGSDDRARPSATKAGLACLLACLGVTIAAGPVPGAAADTTVADNGFRPDPNGFSFENYGGGTGNEDLSAAEMQKLFGPGVCANHTGGVCTLSPPAREWMHVQNRSMDGGHCNGLAVIAQELFKGQIEPFGPGSPFSYQLQGNRALQRAIAYGFVYQVLESVVSQRVKGTPNEVLARLKTALSDTGPETYTLGIYKADGSGGHAITPFAVVDHGDGKFGVRVYDNNYPGETREVRFDKHADTWTYNAAVNPSVPPERYIGTAARPGIELDPTTPGLGVQPCPFCGRASSADKAATSPTLNQVQLIGDLRDHAHLLIRDNEGRRLGIGPDGRIVNTIPGGQVVPVLGSGPLDFNESPEPTYLLPSRPDTVVIDARRMRHADTETVSSIGQGHDVAIDRLAIGPGDRDFLRIGRTMRRVSFTSSKGQRGSPVLRIGTNSTRTDYGLRLKLVDFRPASTLHVHLNTARHRITLFSTGNPGSSTIVLSTARESSSGNRQLPSVTAHLRGRRAATYSYNRF